jgi:hypothetical protein
MLGPASELLLSFAPPRWRIAQSFPPSQLSKGHADQLLTTAKMTDFALRIVALDQPDECLPMNEIEDLGEDVAARVHSHPYSKNRRAKFKCVTSVWLRKSFILKYQQKPITLSTGNSD